MSDRAASFEKSNSINEDVGGQAFENMAIKALVVMQPYVCAPFLPV